LALDDAEVARALLLKQARLRHDIDLTDAEDVEEAYHIARQRLELDMFAEPHDWRLLEEARELLQQ
jgi:hypothetical protein